MTKQIKLSVLLHGSKDRAGISNEELGRRIGVGKNSIPRLLDYPELMTVSNLVAMARVLEIPADEIRGTLKFK